MRIAVREQIFVILSFIPLWINRILKDCGIVRDMYVCKRSGRLNMVDERFLMDLIVCRHFTLTPHSSLSRVSPAK